MPPVIIAAIAAAAGTITIAQAILVSLVYAYSAYQQAKAKRKAKDAYNASLTDRTVMVSSTDTVRSRVYGKVRVTDAVAFKGSYGANLEYYTLVVALAGHKIHAIDQVYLGDQAVTVGDGGLVIDPPYGLMQRGSKRIEAASSPYDLGETPWLTTVSVTRTVNGRSESASSVSIVGSVVTFSFLSGPGPAVITYMGYQQKSYCRITKFLGGDTQDLSAVMRDRFPSLITDAHKFRGFAGLIVDMGYEPSAFPSGVPAISAVIRGADDIYDPRTGLTGYSENPALCARDWALYANGGDCALDEIDGPSFIAAANACDVWHTYDMSDGSIVARPLFTCGYVAKLDQSPDLHMGELVESMGGKYGWSGGVLRVKAGIYTAPVATITDDWLSGNESRQIAQAYGLADLVNIYRPTISDESQSYIPTPLPELRADAYIDVDGVELPAETTLTAVTFAPQALHICGILLRDMRQGLVATWPCNMKAFAVELFDVVYITTARYGWTLKAFEVTGKRFSLDGGVVLTLKETDVSIYQPDALFTAADPAANTSLPAPWVVQGVTNLQAQSGTDQLQINSDGSVLSRVKLTFDTMTDYGVINGGDIEVAWASVADGVWQSQSFPGNLNPIYLTALTDGLIYTIKARASNRLATGAWSLQITHKVIGKTEPPPDVDFFTIDVQSDGTRTLRGGYVTTPTPLDLAGFRIRYRQGLGPFTQDQLVPFQTGDGFFTALPIETNLLMSGDYTLSLVGVDTSGNESVNPKFIVATLPNQRLGDAVEFTDDFVARWPGAATDCVPEVWGGELILRARDQATWNTLPSTWDAWTRWIWDPVSSFTYESLPLDFQAIVAVLPIGNFVADGDVLFEIATSADGSTWGAYGPVAGTVLTRFIKARVTVSVPAGSPAGPGATPICALKRFSVTYVGKVSAETFNDVDTATFSGVHRIGVGDVRIPIVRSYVHVSRVSVALQNVGPSFTWEIVDKDGTDGPRIRIYNGASLADALIDATVEGIAI